MVTGCIEHEVTSALVVTREGGVLEFLCTHRINVRAGNNKSLLSTLQWGDLVYRNPSTRSRYEIVCCVRLDDVCYVFAERDKNSKDGRCEILYYNDENKRFVLLETEHTQRYPSVERMTLQERERLENHLIHTVMSRFIEKRCETQANSNKSLCYYSVVLAAAEEEEEEDEREIK